MTKEYYINDAGAQVTALAWAAYWRYLQAIGTKLSEEQFSEQVPGGLQYRGEYLIPIGSNLPSNSRRRAGRSPAARSPRRMSGSTWCATSPSRR